MFTGIVQSVGVVQAISRRASGARLVVTAPDLPRPIPDGSSISVSGACLTVASSDAGRLEFDVVHETLSRTTLGDLAAGSRVNLEPSLHPEDRMDGHFVQGHIDGTGRVRLIGNGPGELWQFEAPADLMPYIIPKGSLAIDGVSLTIASLDGENTFSIALIPTTLERTTLGHIRIGARVNLETDILVRTVVTTMQRFFRTASASAPRPAELTVENLRENGW